MTERDWATELAETIIQDTLDNRDPKAIIAARLRHIHAKGECDGIDRAQAALKSVFAK